MSQKPSGAPDSSDEGASQDSARPPKTLSYFLMGRTRSMGSSGLQAATIGWVLAGCVFLGFFAGSWLDNHFKTQFWTPILVLLGVVAGFREMFVTLGQVSKKPGPSKSNSSTPVHKVPKSTLSIDSNGTPTQPVERKRERLFAVPAPPTASFDSQSGTRKPVSPVPADEHKDEREEMDTEAVLRALMNEDDDPAQDVKPQ